MILILFLVGACQSTSNQKKSTMEKQKIEELKNILSAQEKWVKVHAAEFLLWEDRETDFVKNAFLDQQELYDKIAQYRIGIWRVLYQASGTQQEKQLYLDKIISAFQDGSDKLHALETLAKLNYPVTRIAPGFVDRVFQADEITSLEIYGLWNLYNDPSVDKTRITGKIISVLTDPKQTESNKTIALYTLRYIQLPKQEQHKLLRIEMDQFSTPVQLQFLASILMNFDLDDKQYTAYKQKLLSFQWQQGYYPVAILALAAKGKPENREQIDSYAAILCDFNAPDYNPDAHATGNYGWLTYQRLMER